jgi:ABC-type sulfate transport system permease subunit
MFSDRLLGQVSPKARMAPLALPIVPFAARELIPVMEAVGSEEELAAMRRQRLDAYQEYRMETTTQPS